MARLRAFGDHPSLEQGLLAYYPCKDNLSNSVVRDASQNGRDGTTATGANTSVYSEDGQIDKCFNWGAVGQGFKAAIESYPGEFFLGVGKPFTINMWVFPLEDGNLQTLVTNRDSSGAGFSIELNSEVSVTGTYFKWSDGTNTSSIKSKGFLPYRWHMITVVWDGVSLLWGPRYFTDGINSPFGSTVYIPSATASGEPLSFGSKGAYASLNDFLGKQSDIGIWNRILSEAELAALYNMGHGRAYRHMETNLFDNSNLGGMCIAEYLMGETDSHDLMIKDTNGYAHGLSTTPPTNMTTPSALATGLSFQFDGANYWINIDRIKEHIDQDCDWAVEMWIYRDSADTLSSNLTFLGNRDFVDPSVKGISFSYRSPFYLDWDATQDASNYGEYDGFRYMNTSGAWNQLVFVFPKHEGTAGIMRGPVVYLNTARFYSTGPALTGAPTSFLPGNMYIGRGDTDRAKVQLGPIRFFKGVINQSDVEKLYNNRLGTLSVKTPSTFYTPFGEKNSLLGSNLLAYYRCNDNAATSTCVDVTGNADGTASNSTGPINTDTLHYPPSSVYNHFPDGCFDLSGSTTDHFEAAIESTQGQYFNWDKQWAISLWYYSYTTTDHIVANCNTSGYGFYASYSSNKVGVIYRNSGGYFYLPSGSTLTQKTGWNHLLIGLDGNVAVTGVNGCFLWLNGVPATGFIVAGNPLGAGGMYGPSLIPVSFGDSLAGNGLHKYLSDIAVWSTKPTQAMADALIAGAVY